MKRLFITLKDIGLKRIFYRLRYEFFYKIDSKFPNLWLHSNRSILKKPLWKKNLLELNLNKNILKKKNNLKNIKFTFLNETKNLIFPINWNNKNWSRLWQFNIHYFDWGRKWIDEGLENNIWNKKIFMLESLLDQWIKFNPTGFGDGWHSYTLSLRIKNWIWFFRMFPNLATKKRIDSLWLQICWLYKHPEKCHGGNHWLENLTTLVIASLQFDNLLSKKIYKKSIFLLEKELRSQILNDGGHEERSAAYHLLILDRLVEMAFVIQITNNERPLWLVNIIKKMTKWAHLITLENDQIPRFNDSCKDICSDIKVIKDFAISYIENKENSLSGLRRLLSKNNKKEFKKFKDYENKKKVINLVDTGWILFRAGNGWEFIMKCGKSCPNHLPAHVHSDLFSFDIFKHGRPIIAECGTSVYGNNLKRKYERSSNAHNVLALSKKNQFNSEKLNWCEPVDVWANFRAARKANVIKKSFKEYKNNSFIISVSHDGFKSIGALYERSIKLSKTKKNEFEIILIEKIICKNELIGNQIFHFGPNIDKNKYTPSIKSSKLIKNMKQQWINSYYSYGFGNTVPRNTFIFSFVLPVGMHSIKSKISISSL